MNKYVRIGITVVLVGYLAFRTDWGEVARAVAHLHWGCCLAAIGLLVLSQFVSGWRWQLQARALGIDAGYAQVTGYYFIGMFFNLILPTSVGGDVVRAFYLTRPGGRRLPAFVSVLMDRINGLIVLLLVAGAAVAVQYSKLPGWICLMVWGTTGCCILGMVLLPWLARWGKHGPLRVQQVQVMLQLLRRPGLLLHTTVLSLLIQVASIVQIWLLGWALGLEANVDFGYYCVLVPMVSVLTLLPVSVNGMGVREGGTFLLLQPLGVSETAAYTLAFLWLGIYIVVSMLGGLVYLSGSHARVPDLSEDGHGSVDHHSDQGRTRQLDQAA